MRTRTSILLAVALAVGLLLLALFLARFGTTKEVAKWPAPSVMYGVKRPIWLSIQRDVAYVDIFSLYPSYRLFVTDGGYAYVRGFDVPSPDLKGYLGSCRVTWKLEGVELLLPDGETLHIPGRLILSRIGPD